MYSFKPASAALRIFTNSIDFLSFFLLKRVIAKPRPECAASKTVISIFFNKIRLNLLSKEAESRLQKFQKEVKTKQVVRGFGLQYSR